MNPNLNILAQHQGDEDALKDKFLTFRLGDDDFALEIKDVSEIIGVQKITPIPDVPAYIRGVINLRGKVVAVLDMRLRLNMPFQDYDSRSCIIVIMSQGQGTGLIVDRVSEVVKIPSDQVKETDSDRTLMFHKFIKGMGRVDDHVKVIIDVKRLLQEAEKRM